MPEWSVLRDRCAASRTGPLTHQGPTDLTAAVKKAICGSYSTYRWSVVQASSPGAGPYDHVVLASAGEPDGPGALRARRVGLARPPGAAGSGVPAGGEYYALSCQMCSRRGSLIHSVDLEKCVPSLSG
jgi:hypothetical protein